MIRINDFEITRLRVSIVYSLLHYDFFYELSECWCL